MKRSRSLRKQKEVSLSKTKEWGQAIDSEHLSEITEEELEVSRTRLRDDKKAYWH